MSIRILVIDDDATVRVTLREVLEGAGYEVTCAEDGRRGLLAFILRRPDLIITDILMPEAEGIETIMKLRALWPEGPIIAISGGGRMRNDDLLRMARHLGATATLEKPFENEYLLSQIARCLARQA